MSPPHSRLSRRYLLHFRLPALPLCPLASTPEPVPPLSPPYYLHVPVCPAAVASTPVCPPPRGCLHPLPSVPPLSPHISVCPFRPCRASINSVSVRRAHVASIHSRLSRHCLLYSCLYRRCRLHSAPVFVPPLSPLLPSVPPLSPPLHTRLCPAAVASTPHPSLSRRCRLYSRLPCRCRLDSTPVCPAAVASIHSRPSGLCRLHACNANATSVATAPACPDAVVTTVCLAAAALSPPHRCRLHSRLSRAAVARPPVSCQTDAVSSERRAEERPPGRQAAASQTDAVSASGALRCGRRSAARLMRYRQRAPR